MNTPETNFHDIVEQVYGLPLELKLELQTLLQHDIADTHREEIANSYQSAQIENKEGKLEFSYDLDKLMEML